MFDNWKNLLVLSLFFSSCAVGTAAEFPQKAISSHAGIVIRLKQPGETRQKLTSIMNQVDESLSTILQGNLRTFLGRAISNPTMAGVDNTRDMCVGVFLSETKRPGLLYVIPVKDGPAFAAELNEKFKRSVIQEKWIIYSEDQSLIDVALEVTKDPILNFQTQMSEEAKALFESGDMSVYINSEKLVTVYQTQLELAEQQLEQALNRISKTVKTTPGVNTEPILSLYSALGKGALQAVQNSHSYTTTLTVEEGGIGLESLFEVKSDSQTDQLFQKNPPQKFEQLGKFPAGQLAYFAGAGNTDALITWGMNFTAQMFDETAENQEARQKFDSIVKAIRSLKFGSYYFSFELGRLSEGVLNAYTVSEVSPSAEMRKYTRQMMAMMKNMSLPGVKQEIKYTPDAEKIGNETVDLTVIKQEVDLGSDPLQVQKRMLEILYGPEGITNRMAYPEGKVLQAMGGTASMKKLLDALNAPDSSPDIAKNQPAFQEARKQGLKEANILALVDVPVTVARIHNVLSESRRQEGLFSGELLKKQGITASYLSFSLGMRKQALVTKTYLPVETLQGGFKVFSIISSQKFSQQSEKQKNN
ncbi:hypothetical protein [Gimesia sp.]|uniref:hypothetical protein n=1 Tax=Gimesia sp. TaxID=2024833 RepID=UPI003A911C69